MPLTAIQTVVGGVNTDEERILRNVRASIRRQLPQVRPFQPQATTVAIVGGGPSLAETEAELREAVYDGAKVCVVNGAYRWAISRNFQPSLAIALDARPENAEFFAPSVPGCQYLVASQCAPETFDMLEGRDVHLWHALSYDQPEEDALKAYYMKGHYWPVTGGSTVTIRAISLLRMLGFQRFELFGFDSCWLEGRHHAYEQALNDRDQRIRVVAKIDGEAGEGRVFYCAPWHIKQAEDFQQLIRVRGDMFKLNVHGNGLIAHLMRTGAQIQESGGA